jgi:hypothetical protein
MVAAYSKAFAATHPSGPAVLYARAYPAHKFRQDDRMDNLGYPPRVADAMLELIRVNKMDACTFAHRGYGEIGVNGMKNPIDVYIAFRH